MFGNHLGYDIIKTKYSVMNYGKNSNEPSLQAVSALKWDAFLGHLTGSYSRLSSYVADKQEHNNKNIQGSETTAGPTYQ